LVIVSVLRLILSVGMLVETRLEGIFIQYSLFYSNITVKTPVSLLRIIKYPVDKWNCCDCDPEKKRDLTFESKKWIFTLYYWPLSAQQKE